MNIATAATIQSAETAELIAAHNLRSTAALLQAELGAFLDAADPQPHLQRLDGLLFAAQDAVCNVERARDEVADLKDEYAHNLLMARRAA